MNGSRVQASVRLVAGQVMGRRHWGAWDRKLGSAEPGSCVGEGSQTDNEEDADLKIDLYYIHPCSLKTHIPSPKATFL